MTHSTMESRGWGRRESQQLEELRTLAAQARDAAEASRHADPRSAQALLLKARNLEITANALARSLAGRSEQPEHSV